MENIELFPIVPFVVVAQPAPPVPTVTVYACGVTVKEALYWYHPAPPHPPHSIVPLLNHPQPHPPHHITNALRVAILFNYYVSLIQIRIVIPFAGVVCMLSISNVSISQADIAVVVSVGAVAAVLVVFSVESNDSLLVVIRVVQPLFTSTTIVPVVPAVSAYAPISVIVQVKGNSKSQPIVVPVETFVAESRIRYSTYLTFLLEATYWSIGIALVESVQVFISAVVASSTLPATVKLADDTISVTSESIETTQLSVLITQVNQVGRVTVQVNEGDALLAFNARASNTAF